MAWSSASEIDTAIFLILLKESQIRLHYLTKKYYFLNYISLRDIAFIWMKFCFSDRFKSVKICYTLNEIKYVNTDVPQGSDF